MQNVNKIKQDKKADAEPAALSPLSIAACKAAACACKSASCDSLRLISVKQNHIM
jgi:hypothetical protein